MNKRAILYARVSSEEQADKGYSLPTQLDACRRYAERLGISVVAEMTEDYSGATAIAERPTGKRLVSMLKRGEANTLIAYQVDRLSRDIVDLLASVRDWIRAGVEIHACDIGRIESELDIVLVIKGWQGSDERKKIIERTSLIPGVETAGISDNLPMSRNRSWGIAAKGEQKPNGRDFVPVFVYIVSPGYVKAMGMRLLEGRDISWHDIADSRNVVIINETVARRLWPGQSPIGRTALTCGAEAQVIGVIADVRESSAEDNAGAQMYLPATKQFGPEGAYLVVRSKLPPAALARSVMITLRRINPGQPATEFKSIQGLVDHATSPRRFFVLLVGIFAGLGLLLASLGIYGVISYSVMRQRPEIGVRMARSATETRVQLDVIGRTMRLALVGISVGVVASLAISRLIASLLFRTAPTDPVTFVGMVVLLGAVALVAGYLPARRASKVDPMIALRSN